MTNDKLKKLVLKIEDDFSYEESHSLNDFWTKFKKYASIHKDYFRRLKPDDFIKLFFYLYSFVKTKNFELSEKILENLFFAQLINRTNQTQIEDCESCSGDGYQECDYCEGTGNEECRDCDGTGEEECPDCDGTGTIDEEEGKVTCSDCEGSGRIVCRNCDGEGTETCRECGGDEKMECDQCDGSGDIEDESSFEYYTFFICSWNPNFYNLCELNENTFEPVISEEQWNTSINTYLILHEESGYKALTEDLQNDELYCMYVSDNPKMSLNSRFEPFLTESLSKVWANYSM